MLDFRYHALSLVAVFLALGIGIVLGSSLGDTVVSQANRDIASSLRGDLNGARSDARAAHAAVGARERLLQALFPRMAGGQLTGTRVAVVASGKLPANVQSDIPGSRGITDVFWNAKQQRVLKDTRIPSHQP